MRRLLVYCLWATLLGAAGAFLCGHPVSAQTITVRLIDPRNGRGVQGVVVWFYLGDPQSPGVSYLEERTDADGTATFHLQPPLPNQLFVDQPDINRVIACSHGFYATEVVVRKGVVGDNVCYRKGKWKWKGKFVAKPGEIIEFARKRPWWYLQN